MPLSNKERQRRWLEKNRAAFNLRRRNARKKDLGLVEKEAERESTVPRTEMAQAVIRENRTTDLSGSNRDAGTAGQESHVTDTTAPPAQLFSTKKVGEFRMVVLPEEKPSAEVPLSTDTRSRSDIAMGIWRNDQGGVISKFAWDKLQKLKEHAKENNFHVDEYSQ